MLQERIASLKQRITNAAHRRQRLPQEIAVVGVSKLAALEDVAGVVKSGFLDIGENRVQEAQRKYTGLKAILSAGQISRLRLHMVGHLQTNKVAKAVELFSLIQSVDSVNLARLINVQAEKLKKSVNILAQVNIGLESSKFGIHPDDTTKIIEPILNLSNIKLKGLMCIAPYSENAESTRPYFKRMRQIYEQVNTFLTERGHQKLTILSMGMSDDFEVAIEEGSTMVRIGRLIFGG